MGGSSVQYNNNIFTVIILSPGGISNSIHIQYNDSILMIGWHTYGLLHFAKFSRGQYADCVSLRLNSHYTTPNMLKYLPMEYILQTY